MENSKIEWCDNTGNIWHGCEAVGYGCDFCYAEVMNKRFHADDHNWGADRPRRFISKIWDEFKKWNAQAERDATIRRVFVGSMMDIAEKSKPLVTWKGEPMALTTGDVRETYMVNVVPNTKWLLHLLLSKRPSNYNKVIPIHWYTSPPQNVMFGTSIATQKEADTLIPLLRRVNGFRFLSVEPLVEAIDLRGKLDGIDWVIVGGESGRGARPCDLEWVEAIVNDCGLQGVAVFVKQMGAVYAKAHNMPEAKGGGDINNLPESIRLREFPILVDDQKFIP